MIEPAGNITEMPGIWERLWRRGVARTALIVLAVTLGLITRDRLIRRHYGNAVW